LHHRPRVLHSATCCLQTPAALLHTRPPHTAPPP
jgi:hypothetical protein